MKPFKLENEEKIKTGYTVPENYFEDFSARVMQQVSKEEPKIISFFKRRSTWTYTAAALFVMALSIPIYDELNQSKEIDNATIENYLTANSSISDAELVSLLDEKDIQEMSIELNIEDNTIENELSKSKDLEHYLLN
ncbi:hypothetical protein [Flavobacterium sp.]|uniref:hypothetical protein n=1 Tax=Flavobacterium sp. TaxID=239 RepID=UPI00286C0DA2|nr:hypothetical protein [Flavobacterium sp.]